MTCIQTYMMLGCIATNLNEVHVCCFLILYSSFKKSRFPNHSLETGRISKTD